MNFFESEYRKILEKENVFENVTFVNRECFGKIDNELTAKLSLETLEVSDRYEALKIQIINRVGGVIDSIMIRFEDVFGKKNVETSGRHERIVPHIWEYNGVASWYLYIPEKYDYRRFNNELVSYINIFRNEEEQEESQTLQM